MGISLVWASFDLLRIQHLVGSGYSVKVVEWMNERMKEKQAIWRQKTSDWISARQLTVTEFFQVIDFVDSKFPCL